jgi:hypothetical protein
MVNGIAIPATTASLPGSMQSQPLSRVPAVITWAHDGLHPSSVLLL